MTEVECALCHQPVRTPLARARRVGGRCWRKLSPDQRAAITEFTRSGLSPSLRDVRAVLSRRPPDVLGQLPIDEDEQEGQQ